MRTQIGGGLHRSLSFRASAGRFRAVCRSLGLALPLAGLIIAGPSFSQGHQPAAVPAAGPASRPFKIISLDPAFDRIIAPDAALELVAEIPTLRGEGPIWRDGRLWLTDMGRSLIIEVKPDGSNRILVENAGGIKTPGHPTPQGPNGLANWHDGSVLVARQGARDLAVMNANGKLKSLVPTYKGKRFNSPNDVIVAPDGAIWFTDPPLALAWHPLSRTMIPGASPTAPGHKPDQQIPFAGVYRYKDGKLKPLVSDMATPNGLAFSPDGKTFYVNNAYPDMYLRSYSVGKDGTLSNEREIFRLPGDTGWGAGVPDGLKVDMSGHIWMTGPGGILVLSPEGKLLGRIQLPARSTNFTFGDDFQTLFIVSSPRIYRLRTGVKGLVPAYTKEGR